MYEYSSLSQCNARDSRPLMSKKESAWDGKYGTNNGRTGIDVEQLATFETLRQLGNMHMMKRDFVRACSFFSEATRIHEESAGTMKLGSFEILQVWAQLGKCQLSIGQTVDAMLCFQRVLSLYKTAGGATLSPKMSRAQAVMGSVLYYIGVIHASSERSTHRKREKALRSFSACLDLIRISLGDDHPAVAHVLYNIAVLLKDEGQLDQAANHLENSLCILRQTHGPCHKKLVPSLLLMASIYEQRGQGIQSLSVYQEVLWCLQSHTSPNEVDSSCGESRISVEDVWIRMGGVQQTLGHLDSAMVSYERAVALLRRHGDAELFSNTRHRRVSGILTDMGYIELDRANRSAANAYFLAASSISEGRSLPESDFNVAFSTAAAA